MKEGVECKNQFEWDFVTEKLGYKWNSSYSNYRDNPVINLNNNKCGQKAVDEWDKIYSFEKWCILNKFKTENKNNKYMEAKMLDVLNKTYDNLYLRRTTVPLFMGNPGIGKTKIIENFAKSRGVKVTKIILSTRMPNEVLGMTMPDLVKDRMVLLDNHQLSELQDGEILFFDEVFNGTLKQTLDSFLNFLEDRKLISGKKLADVMIVAASNPQGLIHLTPQIKQRFVKYELVFNREEFQALLKKKYGMPEDISKNLCTLIEKEKFEATEWDFLTPRSIEKAINQVGCDLPLEPSYNDFIMPILLQKIIPDRNVDAIGIKQGEEIEYLTILKKVIKAYNDQENNIKKGAIATNLPG